MDIVDDINYIVLRDLETDGKNKTKQLMKIYLLQYQLIRD